MTDTTKPRGFGAMEKARRTELARAGGAGVPADKRSFSQNRELAHAAAMKGVAARKAKRERDGAS